ncbi:Protein cwh43 [Coemansia sp. Benny D115]|nr:Protein cwh43 [Coemansia sp. Benny D115]
MDARFVMDSEPRSTGKAPWVRTGLGLGALLFALHSMYADSATVARWAWDGYPRTGPAPVPWGALVLGALGGGFVLGHRTKLARSWLWWTAGATGAALVTCVSGWAGFSGALVLGVYLSSISRTLLHSAASARAPGRTLGLALFWYNVLVLAHVWVVAYEFVPAGDVLRERTWVVMAFTMGSLLLAVRAGEQQSKQSTEHSNHGSLRLLAAADRRRARHVVAGAVVAGCLAMVWRLPAATHTPTPYHSEHRMLTAGIWTVHFDLDNDMWVAEDRIIKAVRDLEVDVMGFLESDTERIIMGGRDWTQRLGEELGYYIDYGPSPRKHTWGCAMASKFPILRSTHHLLPSPVGELACAIHATLDVYGREIDVIVSHNGQEENALDRRLQTGELARIMRESPNPMIFTGYVVTKPHARNYRLLYEKGNISDVDPTDSDRWCQYIGYRGLNRTAYARVSRGTVTDTEIQLAKFVVPDTTTASKNTDGVEDSWKPSYVRVAETDYTPAMRFPDMFKGKGVRGHFYHVFKEPRYFA